VFFIEVLSTFRNST
jgi:dethiobiotin synthetase